MDAVASFRRAEPKHAREIELIWRSRLGDDHYDEDLVDEACNLFNDTVQGAVALGVDEGESGDSEVVGFLIGYERRGDELNTEYGLELDPNERVWVLKTCAVDESWEGRAIATRLTKSMMARRGEFRTFLAPAWIRNGHVSGNDVLESLGFKQAVRIEDYWCNEGPSTTCNCPDCGATCRCDLGVYLYQKP